MSKVYLKYVSSNVLGSYVTGDVYELDANVAKYLVSKYGGWFVEVTKPAPKVKPVEAIAEATTESETKPGAQPAKGYKYKR